VSRRKKAPVPEELKDGIIVTDILDLHGLFPEQIPEILHAFIENGIELKLKRLKLIHGKGKSRLKWEAIQILKRHNKVGRYYDAPLPEGGWGATIIELL